MAMLADLVELVIGVDTHKDTHTAAVVQAVSGGVITQATVPAIPAGYQQLLRLADRHDGQRVWAIEGTGGYGAGLTRFLHTHGEQVLELDRPKRVRRHGARSDPLDATRAAREALGRDQLAQPRAAGHRAALSVRLTARRSAVQAATDAQRQLHALVVAAPTPFVSDCVVAVRPAWLPPVGDFGCGRPGTPRPWQPRPACGPWPAASSS
jgi:transposase